MLIFDPVFSITVKTFFILSSLDFSSNIRQVVVFTQSSHWSCKDRAQKTERIYFNVPNEVRHETTKSQLHRFLCSLQILF